jgi:hypothetical protein
MNSPSSLASRIHAAAHPSCCAGSVAGVECDLIDRIKTAIEETSRHVCSYCTEPLAVSLDEDVNLASARAHMATCPKHPMRELLEALRSTTEQLRLLGECYRFTRGDEDVNATITAAAAAAIAKVERPAGKL